MTDAPTTPDPAPPATPAAPAPVARPAGPTGPLPPSAHRVADALRAAGVDGQVVVLPDSARTAAEAASALGCPVGAIANSLVFVADGEPLLVLTSGRHRVDTVGLARRLGRERIGRATPEQVRAATGQAIGGVAPVGHPAPLTTVVDVALAEHVRVWAAAGTPHAVFPTTFEELVQVTGGTPLVVADDEVPAG
ncbi:YbaK/EbsC family protein [Cellulomonas fimi]|uniref:YbaK/prolyl-tRNA synthetase associated region n=1 Tax=Cellulomonas fimi (strain ATCC 484 / DSM 20113 / JCM 1341 / CCUG 24087 / LMG 16345 / NBRC 15513 / NCIMB 8980 / NCTC 7547 / NRS-133) TaxID=590998 RepID=F4GZJ2_CELFA|nr:YbaK/EbsC family protein [Cellulomonas fimi]AEE46036.1 YbaK/prolyl-tRNA synthetase associated region [Cellulomonas fimi ATCC 484]NNH06888.1 YbaK/EbsC family protein [Cellulomonas fimi]VEH31381.1 Proline--tRNA ligase [Cellulomonas fimi]